LMRAEIAQTGLDELLVVETLHERKALMHARADAIVVLPGGIGTLDELFEIMTWRELGIHDKPIFLLGGSYWTPFLVLLDHLSASGMAPANLHRLVEPLDGLAALAAQLRLR
ncbi:MAG: LOG family protein, partial [Polymorphobacter sp.]